MASGVKVADKVKEIYNEMKVVKSDAVQKKRIRLVMFHITGGYIEIEEIFREEDLEGEDVFQFFLSKLKPERCGYLLYDCHFSTKESGIKEELVFVMWAPETASIKLKMQYAASKDSLKKVFTGIKHELQINDLSDYGHRETFAEKMGKNVTHLEGKPLNC
ncbi:non-muscle cofilin 1-like [Anabas testudineus]|nr:non-muscle cofilin 1-like [Anabas testudineus]